MICFISTLLGSEVRKKNRTLFAGWHRVFEHILIPTIKTWFIDQSRLENVNTKQSIHGANTILDTRLKSFEPGWHR
jgi:hypothetical protein